MDRPVSIDRNVLGDHLEVSATPHGPALATRGEGTDRGERIVRVVLSTVVITVALSSTHISEFIWNGYG